MLNEVKFVHHYKRDKFELNTSRIAKARTIHQVDIVFVPNTVRQILIYICFHVAVQTQFD